MGALTQTSGVALTGAHPPRDRRRKGVAVKPPGTAVVLMGCPMHRENSARAARRKALSCPEVIQENNTYYGSN